MKRIRNYHSIFYVVLLKFLFIFNGTLISQITIKGKVVNEKEDPLEGVNVVVRNKNIGTSTDDEGFFYLEIEDSPALIMFLYIGYVTEEVMVDRSITLMVKMKQDWAKLDQVIVIGYGTQKKSDLTGAISSLREKDIAEIKTSNVIESMQGKAAGVDMVRDDGRTNSGFNVRIRGTRSLNADNQPLYILDGVEYGSNVDINPNDIQSIEILKDASSSAIYGVRGANGVVLITTKKGKQGRAKVSFHSYVGYTKPLGSLPIGDRDYYLSIYENLAKYNYFKKNNKDWRDTIQPSTYANLPTPSLDSYLKVYEKQLFDQGYDYNWYDNLIEDGSIQDYHLAVTGGTDKMTYSSSINYFKEDGLIDEDVFDRLTGRLNLDVKINDYISLGGSSMLSYRIHQKTKDPTGDALKLTPLVPPMDSTGAYYLKPALGQQGQEVINPFVSLQLNEQQQRTTRLFNSYFINVMPFEGFMFRSNFSVDFIFDREGNFSKSIPEMNSNNSAWIRERNNIGWVSTNTAEYTKVVGNHRFQATGVFEAKLDRMEQIRISGEELTLDNGKWYPINTAILNLSIDLPRGEPFSKSTLVSLLGRLHYNYKGKYFLSATGRYDAASVFSEGEKWSFFPSGSVAWRISEEVFFDDIRNTLSDLKIRLGYGTVGNQAIEAYATLGGVNLVPLYYEFGVTETPAYGYRPTAVPAKDLSWETTLASNAGLDFGFFRNRIYGSIDAYYSQTKDLLLLRRLVPSNGITSVYDNVGKTENKGIEIYLTAAIISLKNFSYSCEITYGLNKEKIVSLASGVEKDLANLWFVGQPVKVWYDFKYDGVWQLDEAKIADSYGGRHPGDIKFVDMNKDGSYSDDDYVIIGHKNPTWTGGWTNRFRLYQIDLTVFLIGRFGHTISDGVLDWWAPNGRENSMEIDYWTPANPTNTYPGVDPNRTRSGWAENNAITYIDGSFVKIKDITLGYIFKEEKLKKMRLSYLRVYCSAKNAFAFGAYFKQGRFDPELEGDISWPMPSIYTLGVKMDF